MENKAYKAYVKELQVKDILNKRYNNVISNKGRRNTIKAIRRSSKVWTETIKVYQTKYEAIKDARDSSFRLLEAFMGTKRE